MYGGLYGALNATIDGVINGDSVGEIARSAATEAIRGAAVGAVFGYTFGKFGMGIGGVSGWTILHGPLRALPFISTNVGFGVLETLFQRAIGVIDDMLNRTNEQIVQTRIDELRATLCPV